MTPLQQIRFEEIETIAGQDLNKIYLEELVNKGLTDRHTPEIEAKILETTFPNVTRAMLHLEEYEPIIIEIIKNEN
jgi:hypothetical protein